jgi:DNA-binding MarR family transcriptional regulator
MTGILDRLEKMALIERQRHPEDRRAILICLTPQGLSHAKEINGIMVEANKEFLIQLGSKELQNLRVLLKKVRM